MKSLDLAALAAILIGVTLILAGILQLPFSQTASGAGSVIIFMGPVPIFIGSGVPSILVVMMAAVLSAITIIAVILFRRRD